MTIYRTLEAIPHQGRTALTIGTFDGVHRGHRLILDTLVAAAKELDGQSAILTFDPHPQEVLRKTGEPVPILTPIERKLEILESLGIDLIAVVPFTREFAATPWKEFVDGLIERFGLAHMIVGHDHAFGRNREGTAESLTTYGVERGFHVTQVGPLLVDGEAISSTKIRRALMEGEPERAALWLGRPYDLQGIVVRGDGRGRQIGIPTANVDPASKKQLVPREGVYCVSMRIGSGEEVRRANGMANIGRRPTFTDGTERTIEVHLFDFDDEIYHETVAVEFHRFVRFERTFPSKEAFLAQLEEDRAFCVEYFSTDS